MIVYEVFGGSGQNLKDTFASECYTRSNISLQDDTTFSLVLQEQGKWTAALTSMKTLEYNEPQSGQGKN